MPMAAGVDDAEPADADAMGKHGREQHTAIITRKLINANKT